MYNANTQLKHGFAVQYYILIFVEFLKYFNPRVINNIGTGGLMKKIFKILNLNFKVLCFKKSYSNVSVISFHLDTTTIIADSK